MSKPSHAVRRRCWRFEMKYVMLFGGTMEGIDQLEGDVREQAMADYRRSNQWFEKYTKAGKVVGGEELQGPSTATTVSRQNGKVIVTVCPFIDSTEVIVVVVCDDSLE